MVFRYIKRRLAMRIRIPLIPLLFALSLIIALTLFYLVVEESTGRGIPGYYGITLGSMFTEGSVWSGAECYMFLGTYDRVSFDAKLVLINASFQWSIVIEIEDLVNGDRYNYSEVYYTVRPVTPEFYAPRSSLYRVKYIVFLNITRKHNMTIRYEISPRISGEQYRRIDFYKNAPYVLTAIIVFSIALIISEGIRDYMDKYAYSSLIGLIRWEVKSFWLYVLIPLNTILYVFFITRFESGIGGVTVLLTPITVLRSISYLLLYSIITCIVTILVFSYKWENKHERTIDLTSHHRLVRYVAKLVAVLIVTFLPVVLTSLLIYVVWQPNLIWRRLDLFLNVFTSHLLYFFIVTLFVFSIASAISTLLPYTSASIFTSIVLLILLYIQSPLTSFLGSSLQHILSILYPESTCESVGYPQVRPVIQPLLTTDFLYMNYNILRTILAPTLVLLSISVLIYFTRENP